MTSQRAERPGHAARAQTVIAFGDRGQDEALIPRARYGHSALCRKRPKSDVSQNVFLRILGVWPWARPAEAKATTSISKPNPNLRVKCNSAIAIGAYLTPSGSLSPMDD